MGTHLFGSSCTLINSQFCWVQPEWDVLWETRLWTTWCLLMTYVFGPMRQWYSMPSEHLLWLGCWTYNCFNATKTVGTDQIS